MKRFIGFRERVSEHSKTYRKPSEAIKKGANKETHWRFPRLPDRLLRFPPLQISNHFTRLSAFANFVTLLTKCILKLDILTVSKCLSLTHNFRGSFSPLVTPQWKIWAIQISTLLQNNLIGNFDYNRLKWTRIWIIFQNNLNDNLVILFYLKDSFFSFMFYLRC